jgi:FAD/FMN-containing dehydrogenase
VQTIKDALAPWASAHGYLNYADAQGDPATFWNEQAYRRLRRIKAAVDPDALIRSNHPIPAAD